MRSPREYAHILRHRFVCTSGRLVCIGESFGSYNYELRDEVFPPDQKLIPVENAFGDIDYHLNDNYRGDGNK